MEEYQQRFVANVKRVIENNWLFRRPPISILDMGCEPSGQQLCEIARLTSGTVTGINVYPNFPKEADLDKLPKQVQLIEMDGTNLSFVDSSFDLVISANVIEHVAYPDKFIKEAARVLKPNGIAYIETAPVWTSGRGHHIMDSMIRENCPHETMFRNDGSLIPDWSHLTYSKEQLRQQLTGKLRTETIDYILWYLYDSNDLNKWPWHKIRNEFHRTFPFHTISTWSIDYASFDLCPKINQADYLAFGFCAICRKTKQSPITKRLFWRLRKLGL